MNEQSDRRGIEREEVIGEVVAALHACGDAWRHDADRIKHAESPNALVARVDVVLADADEAYGRGLCDRVFLTTVLRAARRLRNILRPASRFLKVFPDAVPWRTRAPQDPTAASLIYSGAMDAEAADIFASLRVRTEFGSLTLAMPDGSPVAVFRRAEVELRGADRELLPAIMRWARATVAAEAVPLRDREALGRIVRETWVAWAREQPDPRPSWLLPWEDLPEPDREVDRRIGEAVARRAYGAAQRERRCEDAEQALLSCPWGCGHETEQIRDFDWRSGVQLTLCPSCGKSVDFLVSYRAVRGEPTEEAKQSGRTSEHANTARMRRVASLCALEDTDALTAELGPGGVSAAGEIDRFRAQVEEPHRGSSTSRVPDEESLISAGYACAMPDDLDEDAGPE